MAYEWPEALKWENYYQEYCDAPSKYTWLMALTAVARRYGQMNETSLPVDEYRRLEKAYQYLCNCI